MFLVLLVVMLVLSVQVGYYLLTRSSTDDSIGLTTPSQTDSTGVVTQPPPLPVIRARPTPLKTPPPASTPPQQPPVASTLLNAIDSDTSANTSRDTSPPTTQLAPTQTEPELPPIDLDLLLIFDVDTNDTATATDIPPPPRKPRRLTTPSAIPLYQVQMASFRNEERAARAAALMQNHHKSRLRGLRVGITLANVENEGRRWRVVTEEMTRGEAIHLCNALKSAGQDCILRLLPPFP